MRSSICTYPAVGHRQLLTFRVSEADKTSRVRSNSTSAQSYTAIGVSDSHSRVYLGLFVNEIAAEWTLRNGLL